MQNKPILSGSGILWTDLGTCSELIVARLWKVFVG